MARIENAKFTSEMKKEHTILVPQMLQPHFTLLCEVLRLDGYNPKLLTDCSSEIADTGLKYVHNDICYPAILVIGQFLRALESGELDNDKVSLLITQTGGGCRASNYIFLLRKALKAAGFSHIPVVSFNFAGLDSGGFSLTAMAAVRCIYAVLYGDVMLALYNQARSHAKKREDAEKALDDTTEYIKKVLATKSMFRFKKHAKYIVRKFSEIELDNLEKPRVGIVGEIYLKYSPLANNDLEELLISQGAEPVTSGLLDFLLYTISNGVFTEELYNMKLKFKNIQKLGVKFLIKRQKTANKLILKYSSYKPSHTYDMLLNSTEGIIGKGVKMGEGWLLSAEMASHIKEGVNNVICVQPFGCLPNHIVAKGVVNNVRKKYPKANITAIDYDSGACKVNQENRIKLMLMNAENSLT